MVCQLQTGTKFKFKREFHIIASTNTYKNECNIAMSLPVQIHVKNKLIAQRDEIFFNNQQGDFMKTLKEI